MSLQKASIPGKILKLLEQQQKSNLTVTTFCRNKKIPLSTFYHWRRKFKSETPSIQENTHAEFVSVKIRNIEKKKSVSDDSITISFPTGMSIKVQCTSTLIRELINVALKSEGVI